MVTKKDIDDIVEAVISEDDYAGGEYGDLSVLHKLNLLGRSIEKFFANKTLKSLYFDDGNISSWIKGCNEKAKFYHVIMSINRERNEVKKESLMKELLQEIETLMGSMDRFCTKSNMPQAKHQLKLLKTFYKKLKQGYY